MLDTICATVSSVTMLFCSISVETLLVAGLVLNNVLDNDEDTFVEENETLAFVPIIGKLLNPSNKSNADSESVEEASAGMEEGLNDEFRTIVVGDIADDCVVVEDITLNG